MVIKIKLYCLKISIIFMTFTFFNNIDAQIIQNRSVLDWPTGVTVFKPEKCYSGYTIVVPYRADKVFLIDMLGRVVHAWDSDPNENWQCGFFKLLPNNNWISFDYLLPPEVGTSSEGIWLTADSKFKFKSRVAEHDWDGNIVWEYIAPENWMIHHDTPRLDNGNTLLLIEELINAPHISDKKIEDNIYIEITPGKEIVWQWRTSEHYDELGLSEEAKKLVHKRGGDCLHANTLRPLPDNRLGKKDRRFKKGNILTCQRETSILFIIDKESNKIVWKWGKDYLVGPHHPIMLENGNILVYDNGGVAGYPERTRFYTRLVEVNPVTKEVVWEYMHEPNKFKKTSKFFSSSWGSVQRLPNGNTFSLDCHKGRLFEVTPQGEIVWEYISPFSWGRGTAVLESGIYRAYRYSYDDIPRANPYFMNTDGNIGVKKTKIPLPDNFGLPANKLP